MMEELKFYVICSVDVPHENLGIEECANLSLIHLVENAKYLNLDIEDVYDREELIERIENCSEELLTNELEDEIPILLKNNCNRPEFDLYSNEYPMLTAHCKYAGLLNISQFVDLIGDFNSWDRVTTQDTMGSLTLEYGWLNAFALEFDSNYIIKSCYVSIIPTKELTEEAIDYINTELRKSIDKDVITEETIEEIYQYASKNFK